MGERARQHPGCKQRLLEYVLAFGDELYGDILYFVGVVSLLFKTQFTSVELQLSFAVKLLKCFVDDETSPDFPSA